MRILWTHNFDPEVENSGVFMHLMAQGMRDAGVDVDLCYLGNLRSYRNMLEACSLVKGRASEYDLVHSQFGSACAVVTSRVDSVPTVLSLRGSDWYRCRGLLSFSALHGMLSTLMTRSVLSGFNSVVTMSYRMKNEILRMYPDLDVDVIPSPIDLDSFKPSNRSEARNLLGFSGDADRWVLFTTLSERSLVKRVSLAKEAVRIANEKIGSVKLRIATGLSHSEMPVFVNACNLALCTSSHEGWPNCIKEALACNLPFVATDVSDLSLIVSQEPCCRVCAPNAEELAENICEILSLQQEVNLRKYVLDMDISVTSQKLIKLYSGILNERSGAASQHL